MKQHTHNLLKLIKYLSLILITASAFANGAPPAKPSPLHITSDSFKMDYQTRTNIYIDHVIAKLNDTVITADKLIVYMANSGQFQKIIATGHYAHYETVASSKDGKVTGQAETITYDKNKETIIFVGHATATQAHNKFKGPQIKYHISNQRFTFSGDNQDQFNITID